MKQKNLIVILVALLALFIFLSSCQKASFPTAVEAEEKIVSAKEQFKNNNNEKGLYLILDAILLTLPHTDYPSDVEAKILMAKERFSNTNLLDDEGFKSLWEAFKIIKPDFEDFDKSGKPSAISSIAEHFESKLREAQDQIKEGNCEKVVVSLLEAILIIKPVPQGVSNI